MNESRFAALPVGAGDTLFGLAGQRRKRKDLGTWMDLEQCNHSTLTS